MADATKRKKPKDGRKAERGKGGKVARKGSESGEVKKKKKHDAENKAVESKENVNEDKGKGGVKVIRKGSLKGGKGKPDVVKGMPASVEALPITSDEESGADISKMEDQFGDENTFDMSPQPEQEVVRPLSPQMLPPVVSNKLYTTRTYEDHGTQTDAQEKPEPEPPRSSKPVGTTVYQIEVRFIVYRSTRFCGGVRVVMNCQEELAFVQLITLMNEAFATYDLSTIHFLDSRSAAGVCFCALPWPGKDNEECEGDDNRSGTSDEFEEYERKRRERCKARRNADVTIDHVEIVFCVPQQMIRFKTVVDTVACGIACPNDGCKDGAMPSLHMMCFREQQQQSGPNPASGYRPDCQPGPFQCSNVSPMPMFNNMQFHTEQPNPQCILPQQQQIPPDQWQMAGNFPQHDQQQLAFYQQPTIHPNLSANAAWEASTMSPADSPRPRPPTVRYNMQQNAVCPVQSLPERPQACQNQNPPSLLGKGRVPSKDSTRSQANCCGVNTNVNKVAQQPRPFDPCPRGPDMNPDVYLPCDLGDPYELDPGDGRIIFCTPASLKVSNMRNQSTSYTGKLKIVQGSGGIGFMIRVESLQGALLFCHSLRRDLVLYDTEDVQYGFSYNTVICQNGRTTLENFVVAFPSSYQREQFKHAVATCNDIMGMTSVRFLVNNNSE